MRGDIAPSRGKGEDIAAFTSSSFGQYSEGVGTLRSAGGDLGGGSETLYVPEAGKCLTTRIRNDYETENFVVFEPRSPDGFSRIHGNLCPTLSTMQGGQRQPCVALAENTIGRQPLNGGNGDGFTENGPMYTLNCTGVHGVVHQIPFGVGEQPNTAHCLRSGASRADKHESTTYIAQPIVLEDQGGSVINTRQDGIVGTLRAQTHGHEPSVVADMAVRRLTPVECERLQGFPDNYTNIKENCPDGPRYKALGNSMAVPVMSWIGKKIQKAVDCK
jgi:DNA (cytosine-5)-methyltransferase 1